MEDETLDCRETDPLYKNQAQDSIHDPIPVENLYNYIRERKAMQVDGIKVEYEVGGNMGTCGNLQWSKPLEQNGLLGREILHKWSLCSGLKLNKRVG